MNASHTQQLFPVTKTTGSAEDHDHGWVVTYDMPGIDWEYVNALHTNHDFTDEWPQGLLGHLTGEIEGGFRAIGIWSSREVEQEYFRKTVMEVITDSVHELGPPPGEDQAVDFEPNGRSVHRLVLAGECASFADIGPDVDGSAVHALGGSPVAVYFELPAENLDRYDDLIRRLGYDQALPEGMLLALTERSGDRLFETQVWDSQEQALGEFSTYLPQLQDFAGEEVSADLNALRRISFGAEPLAKIFGE